MVTDVEVATALVLIENVALVPPAGTVTLPGTVAAAGMLLDSVTCEPPPGAGPSSVTVPVSEDVPPVTLEQSRARIDLRLQPDCQLRQQRDHDREFGDRSLFAV